MGDELDVEISKTTTKKGVIKFEQSAFGVQFDASHKNLFTPLCCFGEQVKFSKRKSSV